MLSLKLLLHRSPLELGDVYLAQGLNLVQEQINSFSPGCKAIVNSMDWGTTRSSY